VFFARANDWKNRFDDTLGAITNVYPKVSIIIVTYNNLELTQLCVESIFRNTTYPNYEVIIIDNASTDDTRNYLRYLSRSKPSVKVVLNDDNLGFAAANNQGLRLAQGGCLVLLNNDTVVPKGWVEPMLRHLESPLIGLVGPVTNSAGNEAKIDVVYSNLEQMEDFSDRYTAQRRGRIFDISVLAMFCIAMRREVFEEIGFLDEKFGVGMFEDDDYSRRAQNLGYRTVCAEDAFVHHYGQASFKKLIASGKYQELWDRNQAYFESKWGAWKPHAQRASQ
jgi:GT2 family glycosyltransferase